MEPMSITTPLAVPPTLELNSLLKPISKFNSTQHKGPNIETVFNSVSTEFHEINCNNTSKHSLTWTERPALKTLQDNTSLSIRNEDEGGEVVLQNREDYLAEAERILSDTEYYFTLKFDPSIEFQKDYTNLIDKSRTNEITTKKEK